MYKQEIEYLELYGDLPDTKDELIKYIEDNYKLDYNKIKTEEERINSIEWHTKTYTIFLLPKGTPRPRENKKQGIFYVKNANKTKQIIKKIIKSDGIICTRCNYYLEVYQPTPKSSMNNTEIYLAEKGLIRPISKPDFDNVAKTFTDPLEGLLLLNDNLINPGYVEKYYSLKPRVVITLSWQDTYDCNYNRRKILNSTGYKNLEKEDIRRSIEE
jgi:Holliday junction resolvase RusA-like endonuclease